MKNATRPWDDTYYEDNGQVLENRVDRYGEVLLRTINSEMERDNPSVGYLRDSSNRCI